MHTRTPHVHTCAHVHACRHMHAHTLTGAHTCKHTCTHERTYTHVHTFQVCTCICGHVYTTHTRTRPPKQQAASPGLNKHLLSERRHARGHCGCFLSFPGPLNPPFPGLFTTFSPGKFHLDQLWQRGLCRVHWPTDAFSVVPCVLTVVCVVNNYKLGDFIHTHKSPVIWENQRPGEVSWCFYNPAAEPAKQRLSLGTGGCVWGGHPFPQGKCPLSHWTSSVTCLMPAGF